MTTRHAASLLVLLLVVTAPATAQRPVRLGPKVRDTVLDARLDPSFASTTIKRLVMLPFANQLDYPEGAQLLEANFLGEMRQKNEGIAIMPSQETLQLIRDRNLAEAYRVFLGNYLNTGVATTEFLQNLGKAAQAEGVLMSRVLEFAEKTTRDRVSTGFGVIEWSRNRAVVGMDARLLRARDGRELWWGVHALEGQKAETVRDLAKGVGDVLARYFGRPPF